jgi:hypothetical protein
MRNGEDAMPVRMLACFAVLVVVGSGADCDSSPPTWTTVLNQSASLAPAPPVQGWEFFVTSFDLVDADLGKFFRLDVQSAPHPIEAFIVRSAWQPPDGTNFQFDPDAYAAWLTAPVRDPQLEFRAFETGTYSILLATRQDWDQDWQDQAYAAPPGVSAQITLLRGATSKAAYEGESVYILQDSFPDQFVVDGQTVQKNEFDFDGYQAEMNAIFNKYRGITLAPFTKYGSTVGVTYPVDPNYSFGGDASNPITLGFNYFPAREDLDKASAFAHELGHVFTLAYPYVYDLDCSPKSNNVETAANYLRDWLADPSGGGGMDPTTFRYHRINLLKTLLSVVPQGSNSSTACSSAGPPTPWYEVVSNQHGYLLLARLVARSWNFLGPTFFSYSTNYSGPQQEVDPLERALAFHERLTASLSAQRRAIWETQLAYWGFPSLSATPYTDADDDGFVSGLDPSDDDPDSHPAAHEFSENGLDDNLNGEVDEEVLRSTGEWIAHGETHAWAVHPWLPATNFLTRRRVFLEAGETLTVHADDTHEKRIQIRLRKGNTADQPPTANPEFPIVAFEEETNPQLTFSVVASDVYCVEFEGWDGYGVYLGEPIHYTVSIE